MSGNIPRMAFHFIIRFTPKPGKEIEFRDLMLETAVVSGQEPDCIRLEMFETLREPVEFSLHSVWTDEAAFEHHATLPHTDRFVSRWDELLQHETKGMRLQKLED